MPEFFALAGMHETREYVSRRADIAGAFITQVNTILKSLVSEGCPRAFSRGGMVFGPPLEEVTVHSTLILDETNFFEPLALPASISPGRTATT